MPRPKSDFWSHVQRSDGCWLWMAGRSSEGYGTFRFNGRMQKAPRVAWQLTFGPIPDGLNALHHCDNPPCVRPEHLFLGTIDDNNKDRAAKGRSKGTFKQADPAHPATLRSGERHWLAKVSDQDVIEMRRLTQSGASRKCLAARFNIHAATVSRIVRNEWRKEVSCP